MRLRLIALLPALAGCYTYAPIDTGAVKPGTDVRARVSGATADRLAPLLGVSDARLLTGKVSAVASDSIVIEVPTVNQAQVGGSIQTLHQRLSLERASILELESRRLDKLRTTATAGGALVAASALVAGALAVRGGKDKPFTPPGGTDLRAIFLRIQM